MASSRLDLHSLIVFYQVASEESITEAADKLFLTQPTVTYHIRALEKNIGLKLLDIKRQKVFLTQAGAGLYEYAREIYRQMKGAEQYLDNIKESSLRVGFSTTFSSCAARAASAFEKQYPGVKLIIRGSTSYEVMEDVLNSEVDFGIVVRTDYGNRKIKVVPLASEQKLVLVASPSNPISHRERLEYINLCGSPLVVGPETSATRQIMLKKLRVGGCALPSPIIIEVNNAEWGINLVENGGGVGLYHVESVERSISEGRLKELPVSTQITIGADAIIRSDAPEHPMVERFIGIIRGLMDSPRSDRAAIHPAF